MQTGSSNNIPVHFSVLEVFGRKYRALAGFGFWIWVAIAYMIVPWQAKALKNQIYFTIAVSLPSVLSYSYWW